jgi:hypothetical protein
MDIQTEEKPSAQSPADQNDPAFSRPSISDIRKRGRKTDAEIIENWKKQETLKASSQTSAQTSIVLNPHHVEGLCGVPFLITANYLHDPRWRLSKEDEQFLSMPLCDCLNEIIPELARKYPKWAILAVCFSTIAVKKYADISSKTPVVPVTTPPTVNASTVESSTRSDGLSPIEAALRRRQKDQAESAARSQEEAAKTARSLTGNV